jgi:hypothetical protein
MAAATLHSISERERRSTGRNGRLRSFDIATEPAVQGAAILVCATRFTLGRHPSSLAGPQGSPSESVTLLLHATRSGDVNVNMGTHLCPLPTPRPLRCREVRRLAGL